MSTDAAKRNLPLTRFEQLRYAREVIRLEAEALSALASQLPSEFCDAVAILRQCAGSVIVTGMGKAGLVGQKIVATFASTGTNSHFLHPGEAVHGDLGRIHHADCVLALSFSGETEEVVRLLPSLREMETPLVAICGRADCTLARSAHAALALGPLREACWLGLAPSTSTTAMLGLGDALALVLSRMRGFGPEDFARYHPGGSLGRQLAKVDDVMRPRHECRLADQSQSIRQVLVRSSRPGRRSGAIMLVDSAGKLAGIFTDSDLARLLESNRDDQLDAPVADVMTRTPRTVPSGSRLAEAVSILADCKISELPVIDADGCPLGLIDITDLVGLTPADDEGSPREPNWPLRVA